WSFLRRCWPRSPARRPSRKNRKPGSWAKFKRACRYPASIRPTRKTRRATRRGGRKIRRPDCHSRVSGNPLQIWAKLDARLRGHDGLLFYEIPQPSIAPLNMPAHGGFGAHAIARADSGDDGIVLMHRLFRDLAA